MGRSDRMVVFTAVTMYDSLAALYLKIAIGPSTAKTVYWGRSFETVRRPLFTYPRCGLWNRHAGDRLAGTPRHRF
jgi:hypothetical protein